MVQLLDIDNLSKEDIRVIWCAVDNREEREARVNIAWSFEGNGIRTRTTFIQAFQSLGANYVELPNFLKTGESAKDLAGYMDSFYSMYVIRESNHQRLIEFSNATTKPVINAMSNEAHPCEVLTDTYYLYSKFKSLSDLRILLWGPVTNVFKSWHSLGNTLDLNIKHYCPLEYHQNDRSVSYTDNLYGNYDVLVTDAWPEGFSDNSYSLSNEKLNDIGCPLILPTPPVTVGNELSSPISSLENFVGYRQKYLLLPVQIETIYYLLGNGLTSQASRTASPAAPS